MFVAFILMIEAVLFYILYAQMPTSLNFFAIRNVEHSILGLAFEPEQYQALNPFWIMIGSPILAASTTRWATACRCRTNLLSVWYCALAHSSSCL